MNSSNFPKVERPDPKMLAAHYREEAVKHGREGAAMASVKDWALARLWWASAAELLGKAYSVESEAAASAKDHER